MAYDLAEIIERYSSKRKVSIVCHDLGVFYSFELQKLRPDLVSNMVCLDVLGIQKSFPMLLLCVTYQFYNIASFLMGGFAGTIMIRLMLITYQGRPKHELHANMNYSYYFFWKRNF